MKPCRIIVCIAPVQEKVAKQKANELKLEEDKKNLRLNLDDAENRVTRGELARRSLEGELQRLKLIMNDKETENQVNIQVPRSGFMVNFPNLNRA